MLRLKGPQNLGASSSNLIPFFPFSFFSLSGVKFVGGVGESGPGPKFSFVLTLFFGGWWLFGLGLPFPCSEGDTEEGVEELRSFDSRNGLVSSKWLSSVSLHRRLWKENKISFSTLRSLEKLHKMVL